MLLQLVVENVLSFRGKAVISLLAADGVPHDDVHVVRLPGLPPVLKCAAIYGANASGKSNLVKAFELARRLVVDGTKAGEPIPLRPFKLDAGSLAAPSRFEVDLHAAGRRYSYGFVATAEAVLSEWLFRSEGGEEQPLFEREAGANRPAITLGQALAEDEARRQFLAFVAEGTRPNQLFLTECAERNVGELAAVTKWFRSGVATQRAGLIDLQAPLGGAPSVHLVDELDRSPHPLLTRFFLGTFLRTSSVEHPGQVLFTTHDTSLLDLPILSRDSIWFVEKDAGGASTLYSLAEFKGDQLDRLGAHLEEGYLQGRFGAIAVPQWRRGISP